jgi:hypothetical protein
MVTILWARPKTLRKNKMSTYAAVWVGGFELNKNSLLSGLRRPYRQKDQAFPWSSSIL